MVPRIWAAKCRGCLLEEYRCCTGRHLPVFREFSLCGISKRNIPIFAGSFYRGKDLQVIWGYLQVGKIISAPEEQRKVWWHPHSSNGRADNSTNVIFKAAERLSLDKSKPGAGVLRFDKKRVLTLKGATKATWARNEVYDETHIYGKRSNCAKNPDRGLYYAGIWQELGLKESDACTEWARNILL